MKLYGMLDSPYVRRVAITLDLLGLPFEHLPLSVFGDFEAFSRINPVVKAPTLVLDDGTALMESSLIISWLEQVAAPELRTLPAEPAALAASLQATSLALAACEKAVQIVYERKLRPQDKQHQPWLDRVTGQLLAACGALSTALAALPQDAPERPGQARLSAAVAWSFIQLMVSDSVKPQDFPALAQLAQQLEATAAFQRYPQ